MRTDELTAALNAAAREQPFLPDTSSAWRRGQSLRWRRRAVGAGSAVAVTALALAVATPFMDRNSVVRGPVGQFATGGVTSPAAFTVERNIDPANDVPCVLDVVLPPGSRPARITMPCGSSATDQADGVLPVPMTRQDSAVIDGIDVLVTSGLSPAGTASVLARDEAGKPLTAEIRIVDFSADAVFVFFSSGQRVTNLRYSMTDGRVSPSSDVHTP